MKRRRGCFGELICVIDRAACFCVRSMARVSILMSRPPLPNIQPCALPTNVIETATSEYCHCKTSTQFVRLISSYAEAKPLARGWSGLPLSKLGIESNMAPLTSCATTDRVTEDPRINLPVDLVARKRRKHCIGPLHALASSSVRTHSPSVGAAAAHCSSLPCVSTSCTSCQTRAHRSLAPGSKGYRYGARGA